MRLFKTWKRPFAVFRSWPDCDRGAVFGEDFHPNPYFYKYTYCVFWRKSPNDGGIFLHHPKNKLCLYDTQALIEKLRAQNEIYWLYNGTILLRNTPNSLLSIIDRTSPRWKNTDFNQLAPSFDEDTDPIVYCDGVGFK